MLINVEILKFLKKERRYLNGEGIQRATYKSTIGSRFGCQRLGQLDQD